jgi:hypothetical protein
MGKNQPRTAEEITAAKIKFVVGSVKGNYINGKSKIAVPTMDLAQVAATIHYYEQMAMGETVAFELVPVEIAEDGSVTRLT